MNTADRLKVYAESHRDPRNIICHRIGIPLILLSLVVVFFDWPTAAVLFAVGWSFQFMGHHFEGKSPSFFKDWNYLWIGPLFFFKKIQSKFSGKKGSPVE